MNVGLVVPYEGAPVMPLQFCHEDGARAWREWGCNCGPTALAAILGLTLDEVRPHLGDFEQKHYTNPRLMAQALRSAGASWDGTMTAMARKPTMTYARFGLDGTKYCTVLFHDATQPQWRLESVA